MDPEKWQNIKNIFAEKGLIELEKRGKMPDTMGECL